ncbi:MAG: Shedu anti-phage system protein SduA domain-containing protein [Lutisporaceae bacterium]
MNLYERDYSRIISEEEQKLQDAYKTYDNINGAKNTGDDPRQSHPEFESRKFLWCYNSLFPNNYLYHREPNTLNLEAESKYFKDIIYKAQSENEIQSYIKINKKWFIPASIYKEYNFGHHGAYLFPELSLGREYAVDYALLGKSSDGYSIVLVEFEKANIPFILTSSNTEHESVRKGVTQIRDWKRWLDDNREYFLKSCGFRDKEIDIPTSRIFCCLVVSRREFMDSRASDLRSQICFEMNNTKIISYDRLVDNIIKLDNGF